MFIENESKFSFHETVEKINESVLSNNWKIPATHDIQETLRKSGKDVLPVKVIELCNPKLSGQLLENDDERLVASLMPCRIAVYEKSDGKTYISRMNAAWFAKQIGGLIDDVMSSAYYATEEMIKDIIRLY
jgi:uncharacterized protein (DUF302 family)